MTKQLTREEQERYLAAGRKAAARSSRDPEVVEEAAGFAVEKLAARWDEIADADAARKAWVGKTAANQAKRLGEKLHRDLAMGRAGSRPPRVVDNDGNADERVVEAIMEMHTGGGSLGSLVAFRVDFEKQWDELDADVQDLLLDKYVRGLSSKEMAAARGVVPGTLDNQLLAAKKAVRSAFRDLIEQQRGNWGDDD